MLSSSMILVAAWLSVDHLTSEPTKTGTKDSRSRFLQLVLLGGSEGSQSWESNRWPGVHSHLSLLVTKPAL